MKSASAALIALLANETFLMADLLTITLVDGTIVRYTTWDTDLAVSGNTYLCDDVKFKRGRTRNVIGIEVDTMTLTLYPGPTNTVEGIGFLTALKNGAIDGARVKVDRLFMATAGDTSAGTASVFSGRVSDCKFGRTEASLSVVSDLILLNVQMPRNVYQPGCLHTLFDDDMLAQGNPATGCKISKASFQTTTAAASGSTTTLVNTALGGSPATGYFDLGYVVFQNGQNAGLKRTVKSYASGNFTLMNPLPFAPGVGDAFLAYPGCDKQQSTCSSKFGNLVNFRGLPYVPSAETSI